MKTTLSLVIVLVLLIGIASTASAQDPTSHPGEAVPDINQLTAYDQPIDEAIAELEALGLVPSGGNEIFREPYAYFEGTGSWFTPLASYKPHTHIIIAGELAFNVGDLDELETCTLISRIIIEGNNTSTYLDVGLTNDGFLLVTEFIDGKLGAFEAVPIGADMDKPHHILYMAFRDTLTVYVDGRLELEDIEIEERAGTYGISLVGVGANARCEGRNIWGWEVDQVVDFGYECGVLTGGTVNLRSGPGTTYDRAGTLTPGQTELIIGQAMGDDGFIWWQLESENWVRSDIITAGGNCSDVPDVEP